MTVTLKKTTTNQKSLSTLNSKLMKKHIFKMVKWTVEFHMNKSMEKGTILKNLNLQSLKMMLLAENLKMTEKLMVLKMKRIKKVRTMLSISMIQKISQQRDLNA